MSQCKNLRVWKEIDKLEQKRQQRDFIRRIIIVLLVLMNIWLFLQCVKLHREAKKYQELLYKALPTLPEQRR